MQKSCLGLVAGLAGTASSLSIGRAGVHVSPTRCLKPLNVEQAFRAQESADAAKPHDFLEDEEKPEILPKLLADLAVAQDHFLRDGGPVVIAEGVPEEAISYFVETDEARAVAIDFRRADDGWLASLVKMEGGLPHGDGVREAAGQLWNYARALVDDGVEPELQPGAGLLRAPGGGTQLDPDANVRLADDGLSRFIFELDHQHNDPGPQVTRVNNLFTTFGETLRNVVTVKVRDRQRNGQFPGFAVHYRRDDDSHVHVARAFQTGTANYAVQQAQVRAAWNEYGFIIDPAVDDGSETSFRLEDANLKLNVDRFPLKCPDVLLSKYFEVSIDQADFFYGAGDYQPVANKRPFVFDLYRVMRAVDRALP